MIFILHYILFCGALPPVLVYISIYLKLYSDASMSEIGTLLMVLPFLSVIIRPFFCALADRYQAHKSFLMGALGIMAAGYGSLAIAPFFPELVRDKGRLVWYLDIIGVLSGAGAFSVVWSLGDALAVNGAQMAGVSWGRWKLWALVSFGLSGSLGSQLNDLESISFMPRYVPAILLLVLFLTCEIVLLALWPNRYFVMYGNLKKQQQEQDLTFKQQPVEHRDEERKLSQIKIGAVIEKRQESLSSYSSSEATESGKTSVVDASCQLSLLKMIAKRDKSFAGHMLMLTFLGFAINCHVLYFYMHIEKLTTQDLSGSAPPFSHLSTGLILSNCVSEIIFLLLLPRLEQRIGRARIVSASVAGYFLLQLYHATYLTSVSLWFAIAFEIFQGIVSAVVYTLINDVAIEIVERVGAQHLAELVGRKLIPANIHILELKSTLRATMQGLLSGALDGLGGGLGALVGGIFLDHFSFVTLWRLCACISFLVTLVYSLVQWCAHSKRKQGACIGKVSA